MRFCNSLALQTCMKDCTYMKVALSEKMYAYFIGAPEKICRGAYIFSAANRFRPIIWGSRKDSGRSAKISRKDKAAYILFGAGNLFCKRLQRITCRIFFAQRISFGRYLARFPLRYRACNSMMDRLRLWTPKGQDLHEAPIFSGAGKRGPSEPLIIYKGALQIK